MQISSDSKNKKAAIIIPARYNSSRLNGKPLLEVNGKPIIQYVYERALMVKNADFVIVATDDERIYKKCVEFGANVEMTEENHKSGSDRIGEVAKRHGDFEYIINLQGDEPLINVVDVEKIIEVLEKDDGCQMATLVRKTNDKVEINSPNVVKCVFDNENHAMYFSRFAIPYERNFDTAQYYAHIGIYGYRREALFSMINNKSSMLEISESLEQLRALSIGLKIKVIETDTKTIGIDTIDDFNNFKKIIEEKCFNMELTGNCICE